MICVGLEFESAGLGASLIRTFNHGSALAQRQRHTRCHRCAPAVRGHRVDGFKAPRPSARKPTDGPAHIGIVLGSMVRQMLSDWLDHVGASGSS